MRLEVQVLGFPEVRLDGRPVDLALRKGIVLLVYLAEARAPVARDVVATLLWPEADEGAARARLRRTLHKLRAALGADVIAADRTALRLAPGLDVTMDAHAFEQACVRGDLAQAATIYRGDYLAGFAIEDSAAFEEWAFFRREGLRSRLMQALERLVEEDIERRRARDAIAHASRLVALDPLSESAHRQLIRAQLLAGDRAAAQRQLEACARSLRKELGVAPEPATVALLDPPPQWTPALPPATRYTRSGSIHLAYQCVGSGPLDIVLVPGFVSHVERVWEEPRCRAFLDALSGFGRVILFDRRGVGLSDRVGAPPTVAATAQDIGAVLSAAGGHRAVLLGASEGGPGCIHFAAHEPRRLAGLVLYGSLAKGSRAADYGPALEHAQYEMWLRSLIREWGGPAAIETFAPSLAGDRQARAWWAGLLRAASSPGAVKAVLEALRDCDVRHLLPTVSVPTLVLHRRGDRAVPSAAGRYLAEHIPRARLLEIDGDDHWFWAGDQGPVTDAIGEFLRSLATR